MFNKNIDKRMTELYKYVVNRTAEVDKRMEDIDEQLSKIHQFNAEVRPALKDVLDRIKKLEVVVKELETDNELDVEWEDDECDECDECDDWSNEDLSDYIGFVNQRVNAIADYLKVEFKEEGLKAVKK
jgi:DNA repair exonuclease SbcCD ATPase subunit